MVAPSFTLLRSFTVKGVMRWVRMTPLMMPMASQNTEMMMKVKTRRLKTEAIRRVAKISRAL